MEQNIREKTKEIVISIIAEELSLDSSKIEETNQIIEDLGGDSLELVNIAVTLEEKLDVEITDEIIEKIKNIGNLIDELTALLLTKEAIN